MKLFDVGFMRGCYEEVINSDRNENHSVFSDLLVETGKIMGRVLMFLWDVSVTQSGKCYKLALNRICSFLICHMRSSEIGKCRQRERGICFT